MFGLILGPLEIILIVLGCAAFGQVIRGWNPERKRRALIVFGVGVGAVLLLGLINSSGRRGSFLAGSWIVWGIIVAAVIYAVRRSRGSPVHYRSSPGRAEGGRGRVFESPVAPHAHSPTVTPPPVVVRPVKNHHSGIKVFFGLLLVFVGIFGAWRAASHVRSPVSWYHHVVQHDFVPFGPQPGVTTGMRPSFVLGGVLPALAIGVGVVLLVLARRGKAVPLSVAERVTASPPYKGGRHSPPYQGGVGGRPVSVSPPYQGGVGGGFQRRPWTQSVWVVGTLLGLVTTTLFFAAVAGGLVAWEKEKVERFNAAHEVAKLREEIEKDARLAVLEQNEWTHQAKAATPRATPLNAQPENAVALETPPQAVETSVEPALLTLVLGNAPVKWEVQSDLSQNPEAALADALHKARVQLAVAVRSFYPQSDWLPSEKLIKGLVKGQEVAVKDFEGVGPVHTARVQLELTREKRAEVFRAARLDQANGRQWLITKGLLAAFAVLGTFAGYFRLESATKGYYTGWLRAGALALFLLAGVGYFMLP